MSNPADLEIAKALVLDFAKAWSEWERQMAQTPSPFKDPKMREAHAANVARYCTPRKRVYVDCCPSFSPTLTYGDVSDSTLIGCELVGPSKAHITFKCQWKSYQFVVHKKKSGWLLDGLKWKVIDTDQWRNGLIGG